MSRLHLTENARAVLEKRYLLRDSSGAIAETPEELFLRVANAVAKPEGKSRGKWSKKFLEMMISRRFMPNSPTLMNAGKKSGQLSACFVLPVKDTLEDIFDTLKHAAMIQQSGGGTGFSFSELRAKGSRVSSTAGEAAGPISFITVFDSATQAVKQGGSRRGANMAILRVDHPDVQEFIDSKRDGKAITNFNISLGVTDVFMRALEANQDYPLVDPRTGRVVRKVSARKIFKSAVSSAWACGDPGVVFLDRINLFNPTPRLGEMQSTNPCVTGETRVWVEERGLIPIQELVGGKPKVSTESGKEQSFREVTQVVRTGKRQVFRLKTFEGYEIRLTADHRVMTDAGDVEAAELGAGDRIRLLEMKAAPIQHDTYAARFGELVGWLTGDGHFTQHEAGKPTAVLSFYGEDKKDAAPRMIKTAQEIIHDDRLSLNSVESRDLHYIRSARLRKVLEEEGVTADCKKKAPESIWRGSREIISGYLRGLFSADGSFQGRIEKGISVRLAGIEESLLRDVQQLLLHLGIKSVLYRERRSAGARSLPDFKNQPRNYECQAQHELIISKGSIKTFGEAVGFLIARKQDALLSASSSYTRGPYQESFFATVEDISPDGEEDVYDLSEPYSRHFHANGILVHNCGEQPLLPYESCNLGSLNLGTYFDGKDLDWKELREDTEAAVRFLDNVIEINSYPIAETRKITRKNRKIGLGVMGFADLLLLMGIPYDAPEAFLLGEKIMAFIDVHAKAASVKLAMVRGAFPSFKGSLWDELGFPKMRNATVTTVAPTGTISIIAGCSSGIEPIFSGVFYRNVLDGARLLDVHPAVEKLLGKDVKAESLTDAEIGRKLGRAWRPASAVSIEAHVRMQAMFQRFSDSAVSKTINLPKFATEADVEKAYLLAYSLGCKGITVYRDQSRETQVLEAAESCPTC